MEVMDRVVFDESFKESNLEGKESNTDYVIYDKLKPLNSEYKYEDILELPINLDEYTLKELIDNNYNEIDNKGFSSSEVYEDKVDKIEDIKSAVENLDSKSLEELAEKYPKIYNKLIAAEKSILNDLQSIDSNGSNAEEVLDKVDQKIKRFKGDLVEAIIKEGLEDSFEDILEKEQQVDIGDDKKTNIDITCKDAKQDVKLANIDVKKGEDLYIESKIGDSTYIRSQMNHMLDQCKGHHEAGKEANNDYKSIIITSKDYLDISEEKRQEFEEKLSELGTEVVVLDISGEDIGNKAKDVIGGLV